MLNFRNCRLLSNVTNQSNVLNTALRCAFSSGKKGKDPTTTTVTITVPRGSERSNSYDEHSNWELLGRRSYRFVMPGNVGLSPMRRKSIAWKKLARPKKTPNTPITLPDSNCERQLEIVTQLAVMAAELSFINNQNDSKDYECKALDCPYLLREQVVDLFPKAGLGHGPLTAVCVAHRFSPLGELSDEDWVKQIRKFEDTARRLCAKLNQAGFWADFPTKIQFDMASMATEVSAAQLEAASKLLSPGPRLKHVAGCVVMMDSAEGSSRILGWLFTTAPFDDPKLMDIVDEENI